MRIGEYLTDLPLLYRKLLYTVTDYDRKYELSRETVRQQISARFRLTKQEADAALNELIKLREIERKNRGKLIL